MSKQLARRANWAGIWGVGHAKRSVAGGIDTSEEQAATELREQVYREVLDLYEGDSEAAELWLSSPIWALGNQAPVTLMDTEAGLVKVRNLIKKWEEGTAS